MGADWCAIGLYGFGRWVYHGWVRSVEDSYNTMEALGTFSGSAAAGRVVVLSRQQGFLTKITKATKPTLASAGSGAGRMQVIRVENPYQAAAEILAEPTEALVIDFRLLTSQHLRLIKIANELDIAILGVGALPVNISSDELSGVQLIGTDDLADTLSRIAGQAGQDQLQLAEPVRPVKLTPAKLPGKTVDQPDPPAEDQSFFAKANRPSDLLTSEELTSLLEDLPS